MAKVLFLKANPKPVEMSASLSGAKVFIEAYKAVNPNDELVMIDLFDYDYEDVNGTVLSAYGKFQSGQGFEALTDEEKAVMSRRQEVLEEFLSADKIVFVTPMWELSYPTVIKKYLDAITIAGVTFKYTQEGQPLGLLADSGKKVLHIQATGGDYGLGGNFGNDHLKAVINFIGISDYTHVPLYSQSIPGVAEQEKEAAATTLKELAKTW